VRAFNIINCAVHITVRCRINIAYCGMETVWHRDGAGNTIEENSSVFSLIRIR